MTESELLKYIKQQYKGKQPYQTVEYKGKIIFRGTQRCWLSWDNIQKLGIDWSGKKVLDIGSYFGYFSTKVLGAGASKVTAFDQNDYLVGVCKTVLEGNGFQNFQTIVRKLSETETTIPDGFDVTMVLNCLHHIKKNSGSKYKEILDGLFSSAKEIVFEINQTEVQDVDSAARSLSRTVVASHRPNRQILYFKKDEK